MKIVSRGRCHGGWRRFHSEFLSVGIGVHCASRAVRQGVRCATPPGWGCLYSPPGVSLRDTPGYSDGIPSGCAGLDMHEIPELGCDFVPQDAGGELLMPRDCPEFPGRGRRGWGQRSGIRNRRLYVEANASDASGNSGNIGAGRGAFRLCQRQPVVYSPGVVVP